MQEGEQSKMHINGTLDYDSVRYRLDFVLDGVIQATVYKHTGNDGWDVDLTEDCAYTVRINDRCIATSPNPLEVSQSMPQPVDVVSPNSSCPVNLGTYGYLKKSNGDPATVVHMLHFTQGGTTKNVRTSPDGYFVINLGSGDWDWSVGTYASEGTITVPASCPVELRSSHTQ